MSEPSFLDRARSIWSNASDAELHDLLWTATSYPFANEHQILAQLQLSYTANNGNVELAILEAEREIDEAMSEYTAMRAETTLL